AGDHEEHEGRDHDPQADDGVVDRGEALQPGPGRPDRVELAVEPQRPPARLRRAGRRTHRFASTTASAFASAAGESAAGWATTSNRIEACPTPQNSAQVPS